MQDLILRPGVHHFKVSTLNNWRRASLEVFNSVASYRTIGYLAANPLDGAIDVMDQLRDFMGESFSAEQLGEYLLYHLSADVLMIELSNQLMSFSWFALFKNLIDELSIPATVIFLYE